MTLVRLSRLYKLFISLECDDNPTVPTLKLMLFLCRVGVNSNVSIKLFCIVLPSLSLNWCVSEYRPCPQHRHPAATCSNVYLRSWTVALELLLISKVVQPVRFCQLMISNPATARSSKPPCHASHVYHLAGPRSSWRHATSPRRRARPNYPR